MMSGKLADVCNLWWVKIVLIFFGWRLVLAILGYVGLVYFPEKFLLTPLTVFSEYWTFWDANFFHDIAATGYHEPANSPFLLPVRTAFFPFYPLLIRFFGYLFGDGALRITQLAMSGVATLGTLLVLYRLVRLDNDHKVAWRTIVYLLIFPSAFFLAAGYSEALFLLLVVSAFYLARRGQWDLAGIVGGLAALTRFVGIMLLPALLIEYWLQTREKKSKITWGSARWLWLSLIPAGLGSYLLYLGQRFGDPLILFKVEAGWGRTLQYDFFHLWPESLKLFATLSPWTTQYPQFVMEFVAFNLFLILSIVALFRLRASYGIYALASLLLPALNQSLGSMNRFALMIFPAFILLARAGSRSELFDRIYTLVSFGLLVIFVLAYTHLRWVG